jgi:tetratricopeptide (TPR) repeat protein
VLGGGERGVEPALAAAAHAEATGAHDEAANFLRMALTLLPGRDPRRPRLLGRLGIVLAWALAFDDAVEVAVEAGGALAAAEGEAAASEYFSDATYVCAIAGSSPHAWALAREGLGYAGDRRDVAWALLLSFDQERRAAEDPEHPGIPADTSERRQAAQILQAAELDPFGFGPMVAVYDSRAEACASPNFAVLTYEAGDYARCLSAFQAEADAALSRGQLARAARCSAFAAVHHIALGALEEARSAFARAQELAGRVGQPMPALLYPQEHLGVAMDGGWEEVAPIFEALSGSPRPAFAWALGFVYAGSSRIAAREGKGEEALRLVSLLVPWLEFAPAWTISFPIIAAHAAETLWLLERLDHASVVERALRDKVVTPDFRSPMVDGRLALARICALTGRHDEAAGWFDEARRVLDEQGARPLLAITDYDEALMYVRRGEPGDLDRARPLLDTARRQFETIGMTGWIEGAERLAEHLG